MQLLLNFEASKKIEFDYNNIRLIQGLIYNVLNEMNAREIHDDAYIYNGKVFRHFCFSDIIWDKNSSSNTFSFYFSTPLDELIPKFCHVIYRDGLYYKKRNIHMKCLNISIVNSVINNNYIQIKTESPVVVNKTLHHDSGKKETLFFSPENEEFLPIVKQNLIDKYNSLFGETINEANLYFSDLSKCSKRSKKYLKAGKFPVNIIGYHFYAKIHGDPRLLFIALQSGLGAKNAQGCGFIKIMSK